MGDYLSECMKGVSYGHEPTNSSHVERLSIESIPGVVLTKARKPMTASQKIRQAMANDEAVATGGYVRLPADKWRELVRRCNSNPNAYKGIADLLVALSHGMAQDKEPDAVTDSLRSVSLV